MDGSRKSKAPDEVHIKRAVNGGFIVRHSFDNAMSGPSYMPPKEHAFADHKTMMAHVHAATGGGKGAGEPDADEAQPQALTRAPTKAEGRKAGHRAGGGMD